MEIGGYLGLVHLWDKVSISNFFHEYFSQPDLKMYRVFNILVTWGIFLERNASLFKDK
jgi:hypothetical protein